MLLFKPEHVPLILNGTKTQTRRTWKSARCLVGKVHLAKTEMLSKEFFAKLKILRVWQEKLMIITDQDAIAEGYLSRETYLNAFFKINKIKTIGEKATWMLTEVWCVEFEVIE